MNIKLNRSLAIFDIEATGLSITKDRIVELAIIKISPDGSRETYNQRFNPEIPIPKEVSEIHGIYDEDVKDAPTIKEALPELEAFLKGCDFAGYNSNKFDLPMLAEELLRAGSTFDLSAPKHIDVQNIFHKMEQRTLIAAYLFYCNKELGNAHNAFADAEATWEVLDAQIARYNEVKEDVDFLADFSRHGDVTRVDFAGRLAYNEDGDVVYNFGKHKGKTIREVSEMEPGYFGWMLDADFPLYTKQCLRSEMKRVKEKIAEERQQNPKIEAEEFQNKIDALKNKFKK